MALICDHFGIRCYIPVTLGVDPTEFDLAVRVLYVNARALGFYCRRSFYRDTLLAFGHQARANQWRREDAKRAAYAKEHGLNREAA